MVCRGAGFGIGDVEGWYRERSGGGKIGHGEMIVAESEEKRVEIKVCEETSNDLQHFFGVLMYRESVPRFEVISYHSDDNVEYRSFSTPGRL